MKGFKCHGLGKKILGNSQKDVCYEGEWQNDKFLKGDVKLDNADIQNLQNDIAMNFLGQFRNIQQKKKQAKRISKIRTTVKASFGKLTLKDVAANATAAKKIDFDGKPRKSQKKYGSPQESPQKAK